MSLFNKVGQTFEKTKQTFTSDEEIEFVCRSCAEPVTEEYEHCPHCGEATVEAVE
jgi:Zn finger protein HypA/HybF involved in hydrogenase expression